MRESTKYHDFDAVIYSFIIDTQSHKEEGVPFEFSYYNEDENVDKQFFATLNVNSGTTVIITQTNVDIKPEDIIEIDGETGRVNKVAVINKKRQKLGRNRFNQSKQVRVIVIE